FISFQRFHGRCEVATWICKIAKNVCFKYFRKNPINISLHSENFNEKYILNIKKPFEENIEDKEISILILNEINKLKPKYKNILIYRLYFNQISLLMGIRENSAKVLYFRGKKMVKKRVHQN
ncbi:MAG: sigma-70 family RNA polymerase sigma factor, partial [Clostridiales bacterium]